MQRSRYVAGEAEPPDPFDATSRRQCPGYPDVPCTELVQNYRNVWQGRLGLEYLLSESWAVRGGYSYDHGPQKNETVSPFLHDSNRHAFGLGGSSLLEVYLSSRCPW